MIVKARYVVPVDGPVIEDGAVRIHNGRVEAIGPAKILSGAESTDYGDAVILPGLVNAHTHFELSHLRGQAQPTNDFTEWLRRFMAVRAEAPQTLAAHIKAVSSGIREALRSGTTTVGDITSNPQWTRPALRESAIRIVSFGEVIAIGSRRQLLGERLQAAADRTFETPTLRIGISPHAPYTVEPHGLVACANLARSLNMPMCVHLAETQEEYLFTNSSTGPLADYLRSLEVWDDDIPVSGCSPVELALRTHLLSPQTILAHVNYASDDDIQRIAKAHSSVAYCPRTHLAFGHRPHRFREMIESGINVCVGTDSLASNPSLSLLDELRFLRRNHMDVSDAQVLAMGTLCGAQALQMHHEVGSITKGKQADLTIVSLDTSTASAPWTQVLESELEPCAVFIGGVLQYAD